MWIEPRTHGGVPFETVGASVTGGTCVTLRPLSKPFEDGAEPLGNGVGSGESPSVLRRLLPLVFSFFLLPGCNDDEHGERVIPGAPYGGRCNVVETAEPVLAGEHVAECSMLSGGSDPPSSGPHYPRWTEFKEYSTPVPWGYLLHSMEHGAVVIAYECPAGCADDLAAMRAWTASAPDDPECGVFGGVRRLVVSPELGLPSRFTASAWGFTMTADCFDPEAFTAFFQRHIAMGPESVCSGYEGFDPGALPAGCGE
jgi:hypothetical protein